jgi:hypothetical protein
MYFHASPSVGWLITFSTGVLTFMCHRVSSEVRFEAYILFNLGKSGKCLSTLCGTCLVPVSSFYLDSLHTGHTFNFAYLDVFESRNNTQLFLHTCMFSYPRLNSRRYFFASS